MRLSEDLATVLISKREIEELSADIRRIIDGQDLDLRDNREGAFNILKNDIHTLASLKNEQVSALKHDREMLSDALADISHQLKTPLTSMLLMADLLEEAPAEKQEVFMVNIRTGLVHMEWLVGALLKMAKIDAGAVEFSFEHARSAEIVDAALEPLRILIELKNQSVVVNGDAELFCDRRWVAEALTNIIKNASEYSPENSEIMIASGDDPLCGWISVTDSGQGISNADIARLYRRFEGSRSDKGYGIGLPLALAIMRGQNGDIQVQGGGNSGGNGGGNGKGATFTLKLYRHIPK